MSDDDALSHSRETRQLLNTHESLTEVHLKTLAEKISSIEKAIKWAGTLIVSIMLTVLGWAVTQQISANESQKNELKQQVLLLEQQQHNLERERELSARTPEASDSAPRLGK